MLKNKIKDIARSGLVIVKNRLTILILCFLFLSSILYAYEEEFVYDSQGKRNPFIPLVTSDGKFVKLDKDQARGDLLLEGIIYDAHGRSYAVVNASVVGIGDFVGDYQVLKIEDKKVVFIKNGQTMEIELKKEER